MLLFYLVSFYCFFLRDYCLREVTKIVEVERHFSFLFIQIYFFTIKSLPLCKISFLIRVQNQQQHSDKEMTEADSITEFNV